ncbi:hypothetical protein, partial [Arthrobacter sp. NamB2]|uniref:hypothetical protein n=1 Tax=Arthrobacter sp. NamB2 TaxID=2576035 RepID=UPI001679808A
PVPSIDIEKTIVGAPVQGEDGAWTVTYEINAINDGAAQGIYTLTDQLRFGAGIQVRDAAVTSTPDGVPASEAWVGTGSAGSKENVIASDVSLAASQVHTYRVEVVATVDGDAANSTTFACPAIGTGDRGGFANTAGIGHNGLSDEAAACATPIRS